MKEVVIVSSARTPFGKYGGGLKSFSAVDLGGMAIKESLSRANLDPSLVDEVIMGLVIPAGLGQVPARQAAVKAGLDHSIPATTINKVCASALKAVTMACQIIRAGDADIIVAGGMESMTNAPYLNKSTRWGARMNDIKLVDAMVHDGLWCPENDVHMAVIGGEVAKEYEISRQLQDQWAYRSQIKWEEASKANFFDKEYFPISYMQRRKEMLVDKDESPRPETSMEGLAKLPPIFVKDGTITAGNAPGVNDGATALLICSRDKAEELGLNILATIKDYSQVSRESKYISTVPGLAIKKLMEKNELTMDDIDYLEINEAFAAVPLVSGLGILNMTYEEMDEKVNVNGGAVAVGHPIGATGGRILMTLINQLEKTGKKNGICAICSGMGQGDAMWIEME